MQRFASVIRVKVDKLEEYKRLHAEPWAGVLEVLQRVGIRNYSIFLHGDLLFSYLEFHGSDWEAAGREIAADPTTKAWWALTDPCQERLPTAKPGEQWASMERIFYLP
jgi:L-rhamnose mutarotase